MNKILLKLEFKKLQRVLLCYNLKIKKNKNKLTN